MFSKNRITPFLFTLTFWAMASTAQSACLLADGPPNTLVPDGYHYSEKGQWKHCKKGSWTVKGPVTEERPFTPNETGVCLPLENQFTKKNGIISMNFVPEKTRRNFYGFEHECVASTWWRIPGGATVSDLSEITAPKPPPVPAKKNDSLTDLESLTHSTAPAKTDPSTTTPSFTAPVKPAVPSFSAGLSVTPPEPQAPSPGLVTQDYKTCQINCRRGNDQQLKSAENQCKRELRKRYGDGQWSARADKDYNRCRILAARKLNNELRACLLPCKKQAGQNIWMGP